MRRHSPRMAIAVVFLLAIWLPSFSIPQAQAASVSVTKCDDTSSTGTLRAAITNAADGDTINFACSGTIFKVGGLFSIDKDLTIDGAGQSVTIDGFGINHCGFGLMVVQ